MPRFSIVLTTCDRPSLLPAAVEAALNMHFDDFELIVSDNFSRTPAREILSDVTDRRLRIVRTERRLAVSDHWEFALAHVAGEFVMYIGDDNALHPEILRLADRAIRDHDLEVVSWRVAAYFHPDWNLTYGPLPDRGNIVGIDAGTTNRLYGARQHEVLRQFAEQLRLSGCFPCMVNFVFSKARADAIVARTGRLFWAPNPDIAATYFILGAMEGDRYGFFDGVGALGGRSQDSNLATLLSRGKKSRRAHELIGEFEGQEYFPHHPIKFITTSNTLAATVSQGRVLLPELLGRFCYDPKVLAMRAIDDMYVERTVPWVEDPAFLTEVESFFQSLPPAVVAEVQNYRDCSMRRSQADTSSNAGPTFIRNSDKAAISLLEFLRTASADARALAWQLYRDTGRSPLGLHWQAGGTTYVDMRLYGGRSIADAARDLPRILKHFDKYGEAFIDHHRRIGMVGDELVPSNHHRTQRSAFVVPDGIDAAAG